MAYSNSNRFLMVKLISKLRLPSILGWLITGIILGPYAFSLITQELIESPAYGTLIHVLECAVVAAKKGFELAGEIKHR